MLAPGDAQPEAVPITRVTVIDAEEFAGEEQARAWLGGCGGRGDEADQEVKWAIDHVNVVVAAYRVAAWDPHARDVDGGQALRVRLGYGSGAELVNGAWNEALLMPSDRGARVRRRVLSPEEQLAGILTGRRPRGFPSEELLLRARLDLDAGRHVEAALQARAAAEALAAELERDDTATDTATRHVEGAGALGRAALSTGLAGEHVDQLRKMVAELERTVRRRRHT